MGARHFKISTTSGCFYPLFCCIFLFSTPSREDPTSVLNIDEFKTIENQDSAWNNNPFLKSTENIKIDSMSLTAIIYSDEDSAALLGGQLVRKGSKVGRTQVLSIEPKAIIIRNENGIF